MVKDWHLRCWWFGCEVHPQDPSPIEYVTCWHCGESVSYADMVGDTRHARFVDWLHSLVAWWPRRCSTCGAWFGRHRLDDCDIPF